MALTEDQFYRVHTTDRDINQSFIDNIGVISNKVEIAMVIEIKPPFAIFTHVGLHERSDRFGSRFSSQWTMGKIIKTNKKKYALKFVS